LIKEADKRQAKLMNIDKEVQEEIKRKGDAARQKLLNNIKNREQLEQ